MFNFCFGLVKSACKMCLTITMKFRFCCAPPPNQKYPPIPAQFLGGLRIRQVTFRSQLTICNLPDSDASFLLQPQKLHMVTFFTRQKVTFYMLHQCFTEALRLHHEAGNLALLNLAGMKYTNYSITLKVKIWDRLHVGRP